MSEALEDFRARVNSWARVPQGTGKVLTDDQIDRGIKAAVKDYSVKASVKMTVALAGAGPEYNLPTLVPGWAKGWTVESVLTDDARCGLREVDGACWSLVLRGKVPYLRTHVASPWIAYLSPHVISEVEDDTTIPVLDLDLVAKLAAAYAIQMHAAEASDTVSSTMVGDAINYQGMMRTLLDMAKEYKDEFSTWSQARYGGNAFATSDWDLRNSTGRMLFHGGRRW